MKILDEQIRRVMAKMGRRGGKIGGKRRLVTMTPKRRREVASIAARARWSKFYPGRALFRLKSPVWFQPAHGNAQSPTMTCSATC